MKPDTNPTHLSLADFQPSLSYKYQNGQLEEGYYRSFHAAWFSSSQEEQAQFISDHDPAELANFLRYMLGDPTHASQPKNNQKLEIFNLVVAQRPQVLLVPDEKEDGVFPAWIDIIRRLNPGEGDRTKEIIPIIKELFYQTHDHDHSIPEVQQLIESQWPNIGELWELHLERFRREYSRRSL